MRVVYGAATGLAVAFVIYTANGWQVVGLWWVMWVLLLLLFVLYRRMAKSRSEYRS